jgi:hypothetical protein
VVTRSHPGHADLTPKTPLTLCPVDPTTATYALCALHPNLGFMCTVNGLGLAPWSCITKVVASTSHTYALLLSGHEVKKSPGIVAWEGGRLGGSSRIPPALWFGARTRRVRLTRMVSSPCNCGSLSAPGQLSTKPDPVRSGLAGPQVPILSCPPMTTAAFDELVRLCNRTRYLLDLLDSRFRGAACGVACRSRMGRARQEAPGGHGGHEEAA